MPVALPVPILAETPIVLSVMRLDLGAVGGDLRDLADEPFAVDHRVVDAHARRFALVDRRPSQYQMFGDLPTTVAVTGW